MSNTRPQRKATKRMYANDGAPADQDIEMSEGEQPTSRGKGAHKSKSKATKRQSKSWRAAAPVASDDEEQDELDSSSEVEESIKKKRKITNNKKKRKNRQKTGKLELITTLPVELLAEISTHLSPGDLLALSLTSKAFRSLVISPNSRSLWKAARRSVGLPELTAGDVTDSQYAQLVYSTRCQMCRRGNAQSVDFYLRKRLCHPCRKQYWIKADSSFLKTHPKMHKNSIDVCLTTNYSPSQTTTWPEGRNYAFLPDLEAVSSQLWNLEEEDTIALEYKSLGYSLAGEKRATGGRSIRSRRLATSSDPGQNSDDDEEASDSGYGGEVDQERKTRVESFINERKEFKKRVMQDGKLTTSAFRKLNIARKVEKEIAQQVAQNEGWNRMRAIEAKVLALDGGYTRNDFSGAWYSSKITTAGEPLTEEIWDEIKPKIVQLLARVKKEREKNITARKQSDRKGALRPRYNQLCASQPNDMARAALPLFADFLELESVKPFWKDEDAVVKDDAWQDNLNGLLEELDDYRLSVRLKAVNTILDATTRISEDALTGDADEFGPEQYNDRFLERPTSFLVCTLPECRVTPGWRTPGRQTFFGSLPDLLKHQHECHPDVTLSDKQLAQRAKADVVGHFALPAAVVSALSAVIQVGELEDESATVDDLDGVTTPWSSLQGEWRRRRDRSTWLEWENYTISRRRTFRDWRELIESVIQQNEKATKSKRPLEVPTIALCGQQIAREEKAKAREKKKKSRKRPSRPWDYSDDE